MIFLILNLIGTTLTFFAIAFINDSDNDNKTDLIPIFWVIVWPLWLIVIILYLIVEIINYKPTLKIFKRNKK